MKRNKGFTLIELLIVIAIVMILAAIVIPNAINIMSKGNDSGGTEIQYQTQEQELQEKPIEEKLFKPKKPQTDDPYGDTKDKY